MLPIRQLSCNSTHACVQKREAREAKHHGKLVKLTAQVCRMLHQHGSLPMAFLFPVWRIGHFKRSQV